MVVMMSSTGAGSLRTCHSAFAARSRVHWSSLDRSADNLSAAGSAAGPSSLIAPHTHPSVLRSLGVSFVVDNRSTSGGKDLSITGSIRQSATAALIFMLGLASDR